MACEAGDLAPAGATELHTTASATTIPTIRMVAAALAARADFDLDWVDEAADGGR